MIGMTGKVTRQDQVVLYLYKYVNIPRVEHEFAHSGGGRARRRIYHLLPMGLTEIPGIRERMESCGMSPEEFCRDTYPGNTPMNVIRANMELGNATAAMERLMSGCGSPTEVMRFMNRAMELLIREAV